MDVAARSRDVGEEGLTRRRWRDIDRVPWVTGKGMKSEIMRSQKAFKKCGGFKK
jgi:hypothetical protein